MNKILRCGLAATGLMWLMLQGCDCSGTSDQTWDDCVDEDGDGYGTDCMLGPDCDDSDPQRNYSCDCDVVVVAGCPCEDEEPFSCFEADEVYLGVGMCQAGTRTCRAGLWSACENQVLPQVERCDDWDNDCDGQIDERLACNDCGPRCTEQEIGSGTSQGFEADDSNSRGIETGPDGSLTLEEGESIRLTFLWVANSDEGTVSKINTQTGIEEGRYLSALVSPDPRNRGHAPAAGNMPSRTAVDLNGDVWVANRAQGLQGTVTKIAHQSCPDLNGNHQRDSSRDANGDGVINMNDPAEFLGEADECILFTVDVGGVGGMPRAVALDAGDSMDAGKNNPWIGVYFENRFYKLAADNGAVLAEVAVPLRPYGAAIDSLGRLWTTENGTATLAKIDLGTLTASPLISLPGCGGSYGIATDLDNRVWVGGYPSESACRYNPVDGSTLVVPTPGLGVGRGIAADADGWIWLAHSWYTDGTNVGRVTRFRAEDGSQMESYEFPGNANETIGVGIDFDGDIWGVNRATDNTCRVRRDTGAMECFPTGHGTYTYSDFTGFALRNFTAPRGTYQHIFEGCGTGTETRWKQLSWEASVPNGTSVQLFVKAADSLPALDGAARFGPFDSSPADLYNAGLIVGQYLWVEVVLASEVENLTPIFQALAVQWLCAGEV